MLLALVDLEKEVLFQKALSSNLVCHAFCSEAAPVFSVPGSVICAFPAKSSAAGLPGYYW